MMVSSVRMSRYTLLDKLSESEDNIWGLLLHAGYLTVVKIMNDSGNMLTAEVKIPNSEIKIAYYNIMREVFAKAFGSATYSDIFDS